MLPPRDPVQLFGEVTGRSLADLAGTPIALIITDQEWWLRSLESVLAPAGYAVLSATTEARALEVVTSSAIDVVVLHAQWREGSAIELCRQITADPLFDQCIPILLISHTPLTREERLEALHSGAWDCHALPMEMTELLAKLSILQKAKGEVDRLRADTLSVQGSRLCGRQALVRLARMLGALHVRLKAPLAALALGVEESLPDLQATTSDQLLRHNLIRRLVRVLPVVSRASDVIGFLSSTEIAVLAPNTDLSGVNRLAERLLSTADSIDSSSTYGATHPPLRLVAGCAAAHSPELGSGDPAVVLHRAHAALQRVQRERGSARVDAGLA